MPAARTSDSNDICQANLETGLKIDSQHFSSSRLSFCEQMTDAMCSSSVGLHHIWNLIFCCSRKRCIILCIMPSYLLITAMMQYTIKHFKVLLWCVIIFHNSLCFIFTKLWPFENVGFMWYCDNMRDLLKSPAMSHFCANENVVKFDKVPPCLVSLLGSCFNLECLKNVFKIAYNLFEVDVSKCVGLFRWAWCAVVSPCHACTVARKAAEWVALCAPAMGWHYMGHVQGRASNRDILVNNCTNVNVFNENGCSASLKKHPMYCTSSH